MQNLITFSIVFTNKNGGGERFNPHPPSKLGVKNNPSKQGVKNNPSKLRLKVFAAHKKRKKNRHQGKLQIWVKEGK